MVLSNILLFFGVDIELVFKIILFLFVMLFGWDLRIYWWFWILDILGFFC